MISPTRPDNDDYCSARHEHAWLLKAEGLTLSQVGQRLGVSKETTRRMVSRFGEKMTWAMRDLSWRCVKPRKWKRERKLDFVNLQRNLLRQYRREHDKGQGK